MFIGLWSGILSRGGMATGQSKDLILLAIYVKKCLVIIKLLRVDDLMLDLASFWERVLIAGQHCGQIQNSKRYTWAVEQDPEPSWFLAHGETAA